MKKGALTGISAMVVLAAVVIGACYALTRQPSVEPPVSVTAPPAITAPVTTSPPTATITTPTTPVPLPGLEKILTDEQIISYASNFNSMQPVTQDLLNRIIAVNNSLYYKFTGNTFENAKFETKLLPSDQYKALEGKPGGTLPNSAGSIGWLSSLLVDSVSPLC